MTEWHVKYHLWEHRTHSLHSAHLRFHFAETVLLSLLDHLEQSIRVTTHQQITVLSLLDLLTAFDTIDHTILLDRLSSCFGLGESALVWISYPHISLLAFSPFQ